MKKLIFNLKIMLLVFLALSLMLTGGLILQQHRSKTRLAVAAGENLVSLRQRYSQAGSIYDINGEILAHSDNGIRLYHENDLTAQALLHTVGDYTQRIDNTIETRYQPVLLGNSRNILHQLWLDVKGKGLGGDDISLTLDSDLTTQAYKLLGSRRGSIVLLNYKTGEIIVSASAPSVNPQNVIEYVDIPDTSLFNRSLRGAYAPGSVFKLVTTYAWLNSEKYDPRFHVVCTGESTIHPDYANENGDGHGDVDFTSAFAKSCNVFFGEVGVLLGQEELLAAASALGIGTGYQVDLLNGVVSRIQCEDKDYLLSWLSVGQPTGSSVLSMSPIEMARLAGGIANSGVVMESHIIDHLTDPEGRKYQKLKISEDRRVMNTETASKIEELMIEAVKTGTGSSAAVDGLVVAGKTGTVQVEDQDNNALFCGYIVSDEYPYAITVVIEEGISGGGQAAPAAAEILSLAVDRE
jgi:peptidoglycan glycosyltransferase